MDGSIISFIFGNWFALFRVTVEPGNTGREAGIHLGVVALMPLLEYNMVILKIMVIQGGFFIRIKSFLLQLWRSITYINKGKGWPWHLATPSPKLYC